MTLLCLCFISTEIKSSAFTEMLQKYCVPKNENGCIGGAKATYNEKTGNCECNIANRIYDSGMRACKECSYGSFANANWKTCEPVTCPEGYELVFVENGNCPNGYKLTKIDNGNCGNNRILKKYDLSTKTFKK